MIKVLHLSDIHLGSGLAHGRINPETGLNTRLEDLTATLGRCIDRAIAEPPDAILLDVMMPELDGLATVAKLKANETTRDIPVILLTAKAQASDRRHYYAAGVRGVITKPFDPTTLASQVAGFLGWDEP
ncbi:MAG: response regulator [Cyanobacteria bacterium J06639_1]